MQVQQSGVGAVMVDRARASRVKSKAQGQGLSGEAAAVIRELIDVCTNWTQHVGMAMCPDSIEGHEVRDAEFPACKAIVAAERLLAQR